MSDVIHNNIMYFYFRDFIDQQLSPLLNSSDDDMFNPTVVNPIQLLSPMGSITSGFSGSSHSHPPSPGLDTDCYEEAVTCPNDSPPVQTTSSMFRSVLK